jgi:hyperosmotically inducible protein
MMRFSSVSALAVLLLFTSVAVADENGPGEQAGRKVDQAIDKLREGAKEAADKLRQGFDEARKTVDRLSITGRIYARLHWDKALQDASISVEVGNDGVATIRGRVSSEPSRTKAEQLANDTIGVQRVVNELQIAPVAAK